MGSEDNGFILLKTALPDEGGDARLNPWAMGDKGGEGIVKVRTEVRPEGLVGNATGDLLAIRDRQKPDYPFSCIIGFTGRECSMHETPSFNQDGDVSRPDRRECQPAPGASLRADWGERVAAAGAVRRQPDPAVGADLPVRFDLALALLALVEELMKFLLALQECGLHLALLRLLPLLLVVHGLPPLSTPPRPRLGHHEDPGKIRLCIEYAH
jgi:hypothetical protein